MRAEGRLSPLFAQLDMKDEVKFKLIGLINQFIDTKLKFGRFEEKEVNGKDLLILELTFSDEGLYKTMVLVLDKDLTLKDYQDIAEKLVK